MSIYYHIVFSGCSVSSAVVFGGYQELESVEAIHCLVIVFGNLCGSEAEQAMVHVGCCLQVWNGISTVLDRGLAPRLLLFLEDSLLSGLLSIKPLL